uniref:Bidirectional sugar transporter SWEET n=1 Tax=Opuntia streptacantha TaxID=393608 RepID=A0A7C8YL54_OPUST
MALSSLHLHELTFIFGILGNIVSFGVYLAPLPTFWSIYKKKSTQGFQSIPYSVALFSAMLLLYYAFLKKDNATMIITINTIGCTIEAFYLTVYMVYATKKARVYTAKLLGLFNVASLGLIVLVTMVAVRGEDHHHLLSRGGTRLKVVGWICAVFSVSVFAAPLSVMRMVIRTKSVEFMPFCLSFSLTLCAVMWFFYGFLIRDFYIALPNILGFVFGIAQMILYIIYKNSKKPEAIKEADLKHLQELAVDIKLGNIEMIEAADVTTFDHPNGAPEVIEVIVQETDTVTQDNNRGENQVVTAEVNREKLPGKSENEEKQKGGTKAPPRGEYSV